MQQLTILALMTFLTFGNIPAVLAADLPVQAAVPVRPAVTPPLPQPRPIASVQSGNAGKKLSDEMECLLEPHLVANVGSPVEGTLSQVLVDRGAQVVKGQVVARINSSVEAANLNLRKAQEEYGKRKVERNVELFRKELISASEKDEIETQTRIAELEVKQQQHVLDQRVIRSPLDGVVVERYLAPGERVANEKILRIAQVNPLNVEVIVPVELFGAIKQGMSADVSLEPLLRGTYKARVAVVDRVIDAASGTFGVRLELPNAGNGIPAGIKCRLRFKGN